MPFRTSSKSTKHAHSVDSGWAWMIVFGAFFSCILMSGITRSQGILLEAMKTEFDAATYEVNMVTSVSCLLFTVSSLFGNLLGEHFTARVVIMTGGLIGCLGMSLASLGFSVQYIVCTFGIGLGLGEGLVYGNCLAMVGFYFRKRRALANSIALSGGSVGQMVVPPFLNYLIGKYTLNGAFLLLGGVWLQTVVAGAFFRPISSTEFSETDLEVFAAGEAENGKALLSENDRHANARQSHMSIATEGDTMSMMSNWSHLKFTDILKSRLHEDEMYMNQLESTQSSTASKLFLRYASGENIMSASLASLQRISHKAELVQSQMLSVSSISSVEYNAKSSPCSCCCRNGCRIPKVLDFSVLKNFKCLLFCAVYFFFFFSAFNFAVFLPSVVAVRDVRDYRNALLISIGGIADLCGRLGFGIFANLGLVKRYKILVALGFVLGINVLIFISAHAYWQMAVQCVVNGLAGGGYVALMSVVLIDCLGLELLPKTLGIVLCAQGLGPAIGQALLGLLRDSTGSFEGVLIILGTSAILSAVILSFYPLVKRLEDRRV